MKIIIVGNESDNQPAPVKWALEQAGYQVTCWPGLSFRKPQQASLLLGQSSKMVLGQLALERGDAIWFYHPDEPTPNPNTADADKKFAAAEYLNFYHSIAYMLETLPVRCVNKFSASRMIQNKAVQLHLAATCGMKAPQALMSNSPQAVKDFVAHNPGRTICKSFAPHLWQGKGGGVSVTETFELHRDQLPEDEVFTLAPGIFQHMVPKQFDVRTVLMGNSIYSYSVHTRNNALDWRRQAATQNIEVEIIATPPDIEGGILKFAKKSGICFGSFDFAVDTSGQWWFLEVNEQGQFLWLDTFNSESKLLQKFCAFLTDPEGEARTLEEREKLFPSFLEYEQLVQQLPAKDEPLDIAAAAPASPHLSLEP